MDNKYSYAYESIIELAKTLEQQIIDDGNCLHSTKGLTRWLRRRADWYYEQAKKVDNAQQKVYNSNQNRSDGCTGVS